MGWKSKMIKPYAKFVAHKVRQWKEKPLEAQDKVFQSLITIAGDTEFGKEHNFRKVRSYEDFKASVPLFDYEDLKTYIDRIIEGEKHVLWPGKPIYLAKTSGTTSGVKYIPITRDSIGNHFYTAQTALLLYMVETGRTAFMDGKMIFLSGSPELETKGGIHVGRLSGIVNHHIPAWLRSNQLPPYSTNCIEDWEEKVDKIVEETVHENMTLISGIPPWVQMYFEKLVEREGKPVKDIFPNFEVFVYGGVNYEPYRAKLENTIGKVIPSIETYPASEGFIAFQDTQVAEGLLLNVDSGIFYEFVPADKIFEESPERLRLHEVQAGENYAIIVNSNAGLWGYVLGDTVKFVSKDPYRLIVTGRINHFISAFGEHVISEEIESTMNVVTKESGIKVVEFTVAPVINPPGDELPYHQWLVEFAEVPPNLDEIAFNMDQVLRRKNIYYDDLVKGNVLQSLKITPLKKDAFRSYMKVAGKLGGQNKVPRLSNNRELADQLTNYVLN